MHVALTCLGHTPSDLGIVALYEKIHVTALPWLAPGEGAEEPYTLTHSVGPRDGNGLCYLAQHLGSQRVAPGLLFGEPSTDLRVHPAAKVREKAWIYR